MNQPNPKRKKRTKKENGALVKKENNFTPELTNIVSSLVLKGDLSTMTVEQRVQYYFKLCQSLSLNALTKPFDLISLNGKLVMYANNNCAQQLRQNHNVSVIEQKVEKIDDIIITTVKVQDGSGRTDTGTGAVNIKGRQGNDLANDIMKSETKAKRRATLSICGLGMIDETELETVPGIIKVEPLNLGNDNQDDKPDFTDPAEFVKKSVDWVGSSQTGKQLSARIISVEQDPRYSLLDKEHKKEIHDMYNIREKELLAKVGA